MRLYLIEKNRFYDKKKKEYYFDFDFMSFFKCYILSVLFFAFAYSLAFFVVENIIKLGGWF